MPAGERIDAETLASRTGVEPERIEELARLGILDRGADGSFPAHGLATARLAFACETSGIALEHRRVDRERAVARALPSGPG